MSIATIFTDIATGLASFMPALATAVFSAFSGLFLTETTVDSVTTYTLNPLGSMAIAVLVMGIAYKVLPLAYNFIVKRVNARKARKARA